MFATQLHRPAGVRCAGAAKRHQPVSRSGPLRRPLAVINVAASSQAAAGAPDADTATSALAVLKEAARNFSVAPKHVLQAMVAIEKQKLPCADAVDNLSKPGKRWRLVYQAGNKAVTAASKGDTSVSGMYFPVTACVKYDANPNILTNGVFLGGLAYLLFAGPFEFKNGRKLVFDTTFMTVGVGPFKATLPLTKDGALVDGISQAYGDGDILKKKLPFFLFAYSDDEILVARGATGGLAMWVAANTEWQAKAGVLRVMQ